MLNKIKSPALLMGFSKIMDAASDCFVTDFSQDQISALVRMQLSDFANWDIQSYTVTGSSGTSTQCYSAKGQKLYVMKPDEASVSKAKEMIAVVLGGEGTVSDTTQTPEKTDIFTPTTDPNAAASIPEEPAESVIVEEPAESVPEETPAETLLSSLQNSLPTPSPRSRRLRPTAAPVTAAPKLRPSPCPRRKRWNRLHPRCTTPRPPFWMPSTMQRPRTTPPEFPQPQRGPGGQNLRGLVFSLSGSYALISFHTLWPSRLEASTPRYSQMVWAMVPKQSFVPRSTPGFTPLPQIRYGTYSRVWSVVLV